jgi:putative Holliday junction resolvase
VEQRAARTELRILALDVGRRRIGLAFSDPAGMPRGLEAMQRKTMREDIARLAALARERKVDRFVVGLPLHQNGEEGEMAAFVRRFAGRLQRDTGVAVEYQDERLTSVEAEDRLKAGGMSLKRMLAAKRGGAVDTLAALILLEEYLRGGAECE